MFPKPKIKKHRPLRNKRIVDFIPCYVCGRASEATHEIFYGTANSQLSKKYKLQVTLCRVHHLEAHKGLQLCDNLHREFQERFEREHGHDEFMSVFRKNYLE